MRTKYTQEEALCSYNRLGPVEPEGRHKYWFEDTPKEVKQETEEERKIHNWLMNIYPSKIPFYIKVIHNKTCRLCGEYSIRKASRITLWSKTLIEESSYRNKPLETWFQSTALHEYAHCIHNQFTQFDNYTHGYVFKITLHILCLIATKKGYIDAHDFNLSYPELRSNPFAEFVCKDMGFTIEEIEKMTEEYRSSH